MRENLDQWDFVIACYVLGIVGTLLVVSWAWASMRRAEHRRDVARAAKDDD